MSADYEQRITLELLEAIENDSRVTQRSLATQLGIALGLANAYLKRSVKKGLVKVQQAPANRYAYYLTPHGLAEKGRLTGEFLTQQFRFYRNAREACAAAIEEAIAAGAQRLALHGLTELSEIALLCALDRPVEFVGIVDPGTPRTEYHNCPIYRAVADLPDHDGILITDINEPQRAWNDLAVDYPAESVFAPGILKIQRREPATTVD
jgi:DNA-binding MarR family transcriptional regulator